ncbi:MAG: penicillin acylase family protein [Chloroflexota bacterium]
MNWLKRNWKKILTGFVILLALAAVYIFYPVREDLSFLKDRAANYNVKILRDTYGAPHIYGHTDADAAYGLAYAHSTIQQILLAANSPRYRFSKSQLRCF